MPLVLEKRGGPTGRMLGLVRRKAVSLCLATPYAPPLIGFHLPFFSRARVLSLTA